MLEDADTSMIVLCSPRRGCLKELSAGLSVQKQHRTHRAAAPQRQMQQQQTRLTLPYICGISHLRLFLLSNWLSSALFRRRIRNHISYANATFVVSCGFERCEELDDVWNAENGIWECQQGMKDSAPITVLFELCRLKANPHPLRKVARPQSK